MTQEKFGSQKDQELLRQMRDDLLDMLKITGSLTVDTKTLSKDMRSVREDVGLLNKKYDSIDKRFDRIERINKRSWLNVDRAANNLIFQMQFENIRQATAPPPKEKFRAGIGHLGAVLCE
jgi:hypothetical protein